MSSLDLTEIRTGDARRRAKGTRNSCLSCTKRKRRAVAASCMSWRKKFENEVRDEGHGHAWNVKNGSGAVCVWFGWLHDGGPGFVSTSVRTVTNARQVGMRMQTKCTGTHRHARVDANNTSEKLELTGTMVHQVARAMEEQLSGNKRRKQWMQRRCAGLFMKATKTKEQVTWWLDPELCAKARREEVEYIRRHKMCTRVSREACLRETVKVPIKTGWTETDKRQPGKPIVRARLVAKEYMTHARPELCASTPPLAVGDRNVKESLWHWLTSEGRTSTLHHEERYSSNYRQKITRQVMNTCAGGLLQCNLCSTRDTAHIWKKDLASTLSDPKVTRGIACPCVWQGGVKGVHFGATVHGDDITIGGQRPAVEIFIKMISRAHEIKKEVIGEDADLEKIGRILNRVIKWCRDGITIEAGQRLVREILKDLELEQANHAAAPCNVDKKDENSAGRDGSKKENQCEQGQRQTKDDRDDAVMVATRTVSADDK